MSYINWAIEDSYYEAAFIALRSASVGHLALMIVTQLDYLDRAHYVFSLLPSDILLPIFYTINFYQIKLNQILVNNQSSLSDNFYFLQSCILP